MTKKEVKIIEVIKAVQLLKPALQDLNNLIYWKFHLILNLRA